MVSLIAWPLEASKKVLSLREKPMVWVERMLAGLWIFT